MALDSVNAEPDDRRARRRGFQPSVWTFVAPFALAACVLVIVVIAREAGWIDRHHAPRVARTTSGSGTSGAGQAGASILVRAHKGETLMDIAVRYGISIARLRALNPKAPTTGALPTSRRVRLR
jgi:LysM domain